MPHACIAGKQSKPLARAMSMLRNDKGKTHICDDEPGQTSSLCGIEITDPDPNQCDCEPKKGGRDTCKRCNRICKQQG
jgi:hypothetical protein